jgi:hypothetical protein
MSDVVIRGSGSRIVSVGKEGRNAHRQRPKRPAQATEKDDVQLPSPYHSARILRDTVAVIAAYRMVFRVAQPTLE